VKIYESITVLTVSHVYSIVNAGLESCRAFSFEACGVVAEGLSSVPFETKIFLDPVGLPAEVGISLRYLPLPSRLL
jgi:hypothetical protein